MIENLYTTNDLYLAAFLKVNGYKFKIEKKKSKSSFIFESDEKLLKLVNDYLTENGNCEPLSYTNSIKNLKNLLYNL